MRVLSFDPGAKYMGWAVIECDELGVSDAENPHYVASGEWMVVKLHDETWQDYKLRVIAVWVEFTDTLLTTYRPNQVVGETLPAKGFEGGGTQEQLAAAAINTVYAVSFDRGYVVKQVAANTVKKAMTGKAKATKVQVRNGVTTLIPSLKARWREWTKRFNEPDAIAVGLTHLRYSVKP